MFKIMLYVIKENLEEMDVGKFCVAAPCVDKAHILKHLWAYISTFDDCHRSSVSFSVGNDI